ncbi:MAG: glycosyltransferase [Gloeomargarita sp. SKYB31]|nr:glycosyltransferase [Gloeomargarita sp. SKYB31]
MKFSIITPCYNAAAYLPETIESVLQQTAVRSGQVELEYWICDGGSTDGTLELLKNYNHPALRIHSAPDQGMYDALAQGLSQATGEVIAYINAGDFYYPQAFAVVAQMIATGQVDWLTGYRVIYNQFSQVIQVDLPYPYRRELFAYGLYNQAWCRVQQESTFWTQQVNRQIDVERLKTWRYAGDYFLWMQLAQVTDLQVVQSYLGGFKRHPGQLSQRRDLYNQEVARMTQPAPLWAKLIHAWDYGCWRWRKNYPGVWRFDPKIDQWRRF